MDGQSQKRKPGRPKGSKNKKYEDTQAFFIPAVCLKCESAELVNVKGADRIVRNITGKILGRNYQTVIWQRKVCKVCDQYLMVREFRP